MKLTEEQNRVIQHESGHALVSAVAGSGKTTTMVARVRHLLERGCNADSLMVLMFNRAARDHFARSLERSLAGSGRAAPQVRTFHALGLRLVQSFCRRGALPSYTLVDDGSRREKLARVALGEAYTQEFGTRSWATGEDLESFLGFIDLVKSTTSSAARCFRELRLEEESCGYFRQGFEIFERMRRQSRIRFFEDLIHEPLMAMLQEPELAAWVGDRVDHILVDEYQDINDAQQQLLKILAGRRAEVMVVGDVDQCIYEWRGARPEYITSRFHHDFPDPVAYTLSFTFRFGHRLALAANHVIGNNRLRDRKMCLSSAANCDTLIEWREEQDPHPLLHLVEQWLEQGRPLAEMAVLVRLFAASVPVELALLEASVPYRLEGRERVFQCREIKALTGYLKLGNGSLAEEEPEIRFDFLLSMLSQPHLGLPREELEELALAIASDPGKAPQLILDRVDDDMPVFRQKKMGQIATDWRWLLNRPPGMAAATLLRELVERLDLYAFYAKFSSRQVTAENRIATCAAFIDFAARQNLETGAFLASLRRLENKAETHYGDSLLITSIHRAKGLEWPLVVVPGLQDGLFPFLGKDDGEMVEGALEDERRLFYVAMTRAVERLVLIHPADPLLQKEMRAGRSRPLRHPGRASRFLYEANLAVSKRLGAVIASGRQAKGKSLVAADIEVAREYLHRLGLPAELVGKPAPPGAKAKAKTKGDGAGRAAERVLRIHEIGEGLEVIHHRFGQGVVTAVPNRSMGQIRVLFKEHGEMTMLVSLAKLRPVV